jgi:hypothetical protein
MNWLTVDFQNELQKKKTVQLFRSFSGWRAIRTVVAKSCYRSMYVLKAIPKDILHFSVPNDHTSDILNYEIIYFVTRNGIFKGIKNC